MNGKVVKTIFTPNGGYGFILGDDNNRYFFHRDNCWFTPQAKDRVEFDINIGERGLEATNVEREVRSV